MPRDAAPGLTLAWGVIPSGSNPIENRRVGERSDRTQVALECDPGANSTVLGAVEEAPSRTVVAMECAHSAT